MRVSADAFGQSESDRSQTAHREADLFEIVPRSRHDSHKLDFEGSSASQFFWLKRPTDETPGKLFDLLNLGHLRLMLETHKPVALLPDREAETLSEWLQDHPGVEVISRDRSRAYEKGARLGAPEAIQVADCFHLLQNLAEALEKVFSDHSRELKAVEEAFSKRRSIQQSPCPL
jgi:hypothetical protein